MTKRYPDYLGQLEGTDLIQLNNVARIQIKTAALLLLDKYD